MSDAPGYWPRRHRAASASSTGSVNAELENEVWPGTGATGSQCARWIREQLGRIDGPTFFDRLVVGDDLTVPRDSPNLRGYVELALKSGFPHAALNLTGRPREAWLESYISDLLTHDIEQLEGSGQGRRRDPQRLRRHLEAYALNSAGLADNKTIYDAAGVTSRPHSHTKAFWRIYSSPSAFPRGPRIASSGWCNSPSATCSTQL